MSTRFAVIAIWAQDVAACAHFYRDVIGLDTVPYHDSRPHFKVNGTYFLILQGRPAPVQDAIPERFPILALSVDDLDVLVKRLEEHGIALPWGIEQNQSERWVMFHDPGGNLIELVQWGV